MKRYVDLPVGFIGLTGGERRSRRRPTRASRFADWIARRRYAVARSTETTCWTPRDAPPHLFFGAGPECSREDPRGRRLTIGDAQRRLRRRRIGHDRKGSR
jgi:hypothetical protein